MADNSSKFSNNSLLSNNKVAFASLDVDAKLMEYSSKDIATQKGFRFFTRDKIINYSYNCNPDRIENVDETLNDGDEKYEEYIYFLIQLRELFRTDDSVSQEIRRLKTLESTPENIIKIKNHMTRLMIDTWSRLNVSILSLKSECKSILFIGPSGAGKSTVINMLCQESVIPINNENVWISDTVACDVYDSVCKLGESNTVFRYIDTIGLFDTRLDNKSISQFIRLFSGQLNCVHHIVIVMNATRTEDRVYESLAFLLNHFQGLKSDNLSMIITKCKAEDSYRHTSSLIKLDWFKKLRFVNQRNLFTMDIVLPDQSSYIKKSGETIQDQKKILKYNNLIKYRLQLLTRFITCKGAVNTAMGIERLFVTMHKWMKNQSPELSPTNKRVRSMSQNNSTKCEDTSLSYSGSSLE